MFPSSAIYGMTLRLQTFEKVQGNIESHLHLLREQT